MPNFTQKYTIAQLIEDLPDGYEYAMQDWPLHVTLAGVFAIDGDWADLWRDLELRLENQTVFYSEVVGSDRFGEDGSVKVKLLKNTDKLQKLHEDVVGVLEKHSVVFNSPQYTRGGFRPHSTERKNDSLNIGDIVEFSSITLIDMLPDENPHRRRVLGTISFS